MGPFIKRVIDKKDELEEKLTKLEAFFSSDLYNKLDPKMKWLMYKQTRIIREYISVLYSRINLLVPWSRDIHLLLIKIATLIIEKEQHTIIVVALLLKILYF